MTPSGSGFLLAAAILAALGIVAYAASRQPLGQSRAAAVATFAHGALASSGALLAATVLHFHSALPLVLHVHDLNVATQELIDCNLEIGCTILTAGLVTVLVLAASFALSQGVARRLYRQLERVSDAGRSARLQRTFDLEGIRVFVIPERRPDVFAFAVLRRGGRKFLHGEDVLAVTKGLIATLEPDELRLVIEHERAHIRSRDNRYLPFFHALASVVFFDPALRAWRSRLARRHEFAADEEAARTTRRPLVLARALLKVYEQRKMPVAAPPSILGSHREEQLLKRIQRLIDLDKELNGT